MAKKNRLVKRVEKELRNKADLNKQWRKFYALCRACEKVGFTPHQTANLLVAAASIKFVGEK